MHHLLSEGVKRIDSGVNFKDFEVKLEESNDGRTITGYASVFDNVDSYNERVAPGAFAKSIAEIEAAGRVLPMLWNHLSDEPIGKWTSLAEDERGLKVVGELLVGKIRRADETAAAIKEGIVSGLSIGYRVKDYSRDEETGVWTLKELSLREISPVTFPANVEARIETIKAKLAHGGTLEKREFERLLRDAGLSKAEAIRACRAGYAGYAGEGEPAGNEKATLDALQDLRSLFQTKHA